jgi:hypothetical protein
MEPFCSGAVVRKEKFLKRDERSTKKTLPQLFVVKETRCLQTLRDLSFWLIPSVCSYLLKANNAMTKLLDSCSVLFTQKMREAANKVMLPYVEGSDITSLLCLVRIRLGTNNAHVTCAHVMLTRAVWM